MGQIIGYQRVSTVTRTPPPARRDRTGRGVHRPRQRQGHQPTTVAGDDRTSAKATRSVVHCMDRLARSLVDLRRTVDELTARVYGSVREGRPDIRRHSDPCGDPDAVGHGRVRRVRARPAPGTPARRHRPRQDQGKYKGRVPSLTDEQAAAVVARLAEGESASALAREFGAAGDRLQRPRGHSPVALTGDMRRVDGPGPVRRPPGCAHAAGTATPRSTAGSAGSVTRLTVKRVPQDTHL